MERHEEEEEDEECESGRRSSPINLATKVGVLVPGEEMLISEEKSLKLPLVLPLVLIFWNFQNQQTS